MSKHKIDDPGCCILSLACWLAALVLVFALIAVPVVLAVIR